MISLCQMVESITIASDRNRLKRTRTPSCRGTRVLLAKKSFGSRDAKGSEIALASNCCFEGCGNDPSAGSPTETLLRLHLPLNDEV